MHVYRCSRLSINLYPHLVHPSSTQYMECMEEKQRNGRSELQSASTKSFSSLPLHRRARLHFSLLCCLPDVFPSPLSLSVSLTYSLFRFPLFRWRRLRFLSHKHTQTRSASELEAVCMHTKQRALEESSLTPRRGYPISFTRRHGKEL